MIATEQEEVFRMLDLVSEKETDGFYRLLASVYIISQEQVVHVSRETTELKEFEKI